MIEKFKELLEMNGYDDNQRILIVALMKDAQNLYASEQAKTYLGMQPNLGSLSTLVSQFTQNNAFLQQYNSNLQLSPYYSSGLSSGGATLSSAAAASVLGIGGYGNMTGYDPSTDTINGMPAYQSLRRDLRE